MNISQLFPARWRTSGVAIAVLCSVAARAHAFGVVSGAAGLPLTQTQEQLILIDHPDATLTAIVQIELDGPAQDVTWVLPLSGAREPSVALSSSVVFQRLAGVTNPQYWVELADPCTLQDADAAVDASDGMLGPHETPANVHIAEQDGGGKLEYITLAVDSDPAAALAAQGYALSEDVAAALAPYEQRGGYLLAVKLHKAEGATLIRPLSITFESELPTLPMRATAAGAQRDMPLRVWVFGPSQAVPDNYRSMLVNDALFNWQSADKFPAGTLPTNGAGAFGPSARALDNYTAVITRAADQAPGGQAFLTENATPASHVRGIIWSDIDTSNVDRMQTQAFEDGSAAIQLALESFRNWDGFADAVAATTQLPEGVSVAQLLADPAAVSGKAHVDTPRFVELLVAQVTDPVRNTAKLLSSGPLLTRLFTTLSPDEMTLDPVFRYNQDLALVNNVHIAKQRLQCQPGADPASAAWRMELPQGGAVRQVAGADASAWPITLDAMPANLKLVQLSAEGPGEVVQDNSQAIGRALFEASGVNGTGSAIPRTPENGVLIGREQTVVPQLRASASLRSTPGASRGTCSVSAPGGDMRGAGWLVLSLWMSALRSRAWRLARLRRYGLQASAARSRLDTAAAVGRTHGPARLRLGSHLTERVRSLLLLVAAAVLGGCSDVAATSSMPDAAALSSAGALTPAELRDPESCKSCHPVHYREWSSSMHAFASRDPVFRAMNKRGQRETHGELGDFCLQCHAPMSVRDQLTRDGGNLDELPHEDRGVTCYFCHSVIGVEGTHNGQLRLASDSIFRGPLDKPLATTAHGAVQSLHFDENKYESSSMCGACHDILMPKGVAIERTFEEYKNGLFSKSATGKPPTFGSCMTCHMGGHRRPAATVAGAPERIVHEHLWPGVDVALGDFPHRDALRSAVEDCQLGNASVSYFSLEVTEPNLFTFLIETSAGHNQPSGASQDRRMWLEFLAYDADGKLIDEASSGNIAEGELEEKPGRDPQLVLWGDRLFDGKGKRVHMFWDAAKSAEHPSGYESLSLPVASTTYVEGKHAIVKQLRAALPGGGLPARVTARLRIRPIGQDVLQDLVQSGDLDPAIAAQVPTMSFGAHIEWTQADGTQKPVYASVDSDCKTYGCLLDPDAKECSSP